MDNHELDKILGMSLEERKALQQQAIEEIERDPNRYAELDEQQKAKSLYMMEKNEAFLMSIAESLKDFPEGDEEIEDLNEKEILFLNYIHKKKTNLSGIAGYWLYSDEYRIDILKAMQVFLKCGLLRRSDIKYDISKSTIPELKEYAKKQGITVKGNKNKIIETILSSIQYSELEKEFGGKYYLRTEKGDRLIEQNEFIISLHIHKTQPEVTISKAVSLKKQYPELSEKEVLIRILSERLMCYNQDCPGLRRNCFYEISETYRIHKDYENQLKYLLVTCLMDYMFSFYKDIEPFTIDSIAKIREISVMLSLSACDLDNFFDICKAEAEYEKYELDTYNSFKSEISEQLFNRNYNLKLKIDDHSEFLKNYYCENKRKNDISPYFLNDVSNKIIDEMNIKYNIEKEKALIHILNDILNDDNMSKYQLSLTCKKLGDYYYDAKRFKESNDIYNIGLKLNSKLPVKKKIKETEKILHIE